MSQKNDDGKRSARERMQAERARQQAADKRKRALIIGGSVVAVLAVAAGVGILVGTSKSDKNDTSWATVADRPLKLPNGLTSTVIPVGSNPKAPVLTVYEDFRCPICGLVESKFGSTLQQLVDAGTIRLEFQIASFIDKNVGGTGSKYAANAAGCAQNAGKFKAFHDVLYANQPGEADDKFGKTSYLLDLASKVEGLRSPAFDQCVNDLTFAPWVKASQEDFNNAKIGDEKLTGTPNLAMNNQHVEFAENKQFMTPEAFKAQIERIAASMPK